MMMIKLDRLLLKRASFACFKLMLICFVTAVSPTTTRFTLQEWGILGE
jgi:hypothetical protein